SIEHQLASKSHQALRAVVGYLDAGDLLQRTVRLRGIRNQFRGIPVDLVEMPAIRRNPAVARSAGDGSVEPPGGAVPRTLAARGILRNGELGALAIDGVTSDIAVAEVRSVHSSVIRGDGEPAQLRRQTCARVDLHKRADADLAFFTDGADGASVPDS